MTIEQDWEENLVSSLYATEGQVDSSDDNDGDGSCSTSVITLELLCIT